MATVTIQAKKLIDAQTAAAAGAFVVHGAHRNGVTVSAAGLAGAETGDLQISQDGGATWTDVFQNGTQVQLTTTNTVLFLDSPGQFRINKGITAGAVTVALHVPGAL